MTVTISGTAGITTPGLNNTGTTVITSLTTTGDTILGDASTDTLNVGNGNLVTDTSGNLTVLGKATIQGLTVGKGAGSVATNTAVGASALAANSTGANSVAVGYRAANASTGSAVTAVGADALRLATADRNTAVGRSALEVDTTGSYGTAIGFASLNANTTGSYNTAIGDSALASNTTSSYSTAIGYTAGYSGNTSAYYNVYVGSRSGYSATGSQNTFVGDYSGNLVTSGEKNTILGRFSGNQNGLDMRTINNVVVLSDGDGNLILNAQKDASIALQGAITKAGIGITFPAAQSASSDANTLDDYEEGTWTTTYNVATNLTGTPTLSQAIYTKIGRLVTVVGKISGYSITSSNTATYPVINLPFPMAANDTAITGSVFAVVGAVYISGVAVDNTGGDNTSLALIMPAVSVTTTGTVSIVFTVVYQTTT